MKTRPFDASKLLRLAALGSLLLAGRCLAYDAIWTGTAGDGDFFNPANWSTPDASPLPPVNDSKINIGENGGTATIDTNSPFNTYGGVISDVNYVDLGDSTGVTTNQGNLIINNGFVHMSENSGDLNGYIGWNSNGYSTFVVNGGTVYFDGPDGRVSGKTGNLWNPHQNSPNNFSGVNNINFNCGTSFSAPSSPAQAATVGYCSFGQLELHSNALMRVATVVKFAATGATTNATLNYPTVTESSVLIMDGNSELDCGDGFTVVKDLGYTTISLTDNAKLVIGNSMGAGSPYGSSQQGYYTDGARNNSVSTTTISGNAQLQCMTLQSRAPGTILVTNNGKFMIYNVLAGSGTILYPYESSYIAGVDATNNPYGEGTNVVFTVADHGTFYVDTQYFYGINTTPVAWSNLVNGLAIGNGNFSGGVKGGSGYGSRGVLRIQDYGTLDIRQGLYLGTAVSPFSDGTLQIVGPNTTNTIGGNLQLCVGYDGAVVGGGASGRLSAVITGPTHSTVVVSNNAYLHQQGTLKVELSGYTPVGGETYTLIKTVNGTVDGAFATNDFSLAKLLPGLVWNETATSTSLVLNVANTFTVNQSGTNAIVTWSGTNGILQSSTNVTTPFTDIVPTASSPYTNSLTNIAQYFRLRQNVTNILYQ